MGYEEQGIALMRAWHKDRRLRRAARASPDGLVFEPEPGQDAMLQRMYARVGILTLAPTPLWTMQRSCV
jgi:hypothetical protein